ncbi:MAG: TetR/AcrR family transcriptional regulator [Clostridia bacterium]|nr:TetR/AcrR family transcriptional regulator [Clostridia bacterium]
MARIKRGDLTKLQIIQVACKHFLENGYSTTSVKAICDELEMSPGNLTFYFPTKEHLLELLVDLLCRFQYQLMEKEADDGLSSVIAVCLELATLAAACEEDAAMYDCTFSAYTSPLCLAIIRRNDAERAKKVFATYCSDWTDRQFAVSEMLVSGIEYATIMQAGDVISLEARIAGALHEILSIYHVPHEVRQAKVERVLAMDYRRISRNVFTQFKSFVNEANEQALHDLLKI